MNIVPWLTETALLRFLVIGPDIAAVVLVVQFWGAVAAWCCPPQVRRAASVRPRPPRVPRI
jgi:hypothetical protein